MSSLESDYEELIDYISERQPQSQIIMLDNVWNLPVSHEMKCRVSAKKKVFFIDLHDLWDDETLLCGLGIKVSGDDGELHIVDHKGVAGHPGDSYMEEIARRIFSCVWQGVRGEQLK